MKKTLALLAIILGLASGRAGAQGIPDLLPVPAGVGAAERTLLTQRRASLVAEEQAIFASVERHDAECTTIDPDNASLVARCSASDAQIRARMDAYGRAVEAFNGDVGDLQRAKAPIAVATGRATGQVALSNGGAAVPAALGTTVKFDKVVTGPNSSFAFDLPNGATFMVGPSTSAVLESIPKSQSAWQSGEDVVLAVGSSTKGVLRSWLKGPRLVAWARKTTARRFNIRTSMAATAVRGTDLIIKMDGTGASIWQLLEGKLEITTLKGRVLMLNAGQQVQVKAGGDIGEVVAIDSRLAAQAWEQGLHGPR